MNSNMDKAPIEEEDKDYTLETINAWGDNIQLYRDVYQKIFQKQASKEIIDLELEEGKSLIYNLDQMDKKQINL